MKTQSCTKGTKLERIFLMNIDAKDPNTCKPNTGTHLKHHSLSPSWLYYLHVGIVQPTQINKCNKSHKLTQSHGFIKQKSQCQAWGTLF